MPKPDEVPVRVQRRKQGELPLREHDGPRELEIDAPVISQTFWWKPPMAVSE